MRMNPKSKIPSFQLQPMCAAVLLAFSVNASANPNGGAVVNGSASFNTSGNTLTVTNTPGTIINWQGFSINSNEITHFAQQSASSAVLNRVITSNPSVILGTLSSNGRVFLVNPGGIVFGAGSTVDVAGMVATSLNLSDADFLAGRGNFTNVAGAQAVSNAGNITAQSGGEIYLIAPNVENSGVITAPNGEILLAAGHEVQLVNTLDPNLRVNITAPAGDATNVGQLVASAGRLGLFGTVVKNTGTASADSATLQGGKIVFKASQRVEVGGTVSANGTSGGSVNIAADHSADLGAPGSVIHTGSIQVRGTTGAGGAVNLSGDSILSSAGISTDGTTAGGQISVQAGNRAISTASAQYTANSTQGQGGDILVAATVSNYTSGSYSVTGVTGGNLTLAGNEIKLAGTQLDAGGTNGGGNIHIGGLMHGATGFAAHGIALANASNVLSNSATNILADALQNGNGGEVVLWSDQTMRFAGNISAKGGGQSGNGGNAEVSGLTSLGYGGLTNLSAANGLNGTLLLDPRNITIAPGSGASPFMEIFDPTPGAGEGFGGLQNLVLSSGNIVVASPYDDLFGVDSGAVYLYSSTGILLSTLVGSAAGDKVGGVTQNGWIGPVDSGGLTALGNGNVIVSSNNWNGTFGAVTWMNGTTGALSDGATGGTVAATNSLVGAGAGDKVGTYTIGIYDLSGIHGLTSNDVVIHSSNWGGVGVAANALGAVTWMSGTTGRLSNTLTGGIVSSANSLVGSVAGDKVGMNTVGANDQSGLTFLVGGNLLIASNNWSGTFGALTWMSGTTGLLSTGLSGDVVSGVNSLVGSTAGDKVGGGLVSQLLNNNLAIITTNWNNGGAIANAGAVTWMNGSNGKLSNTLNGGAISSANSLVGNVAGDQVGSGGITMLTNYSTFWNYAVRSNLWGGTLGAVSWVNGSTGLLSDGTSAGGVVAATNSVVGSTAGDKIGTMTFNWFGVNDQTGLLLVGNGNLVVASNNWNGARGAVTWMSGATGLLSNGLAGGAVSDGSLLPANSLVGSTSGDRLGTAVYSYGLYEYSGLTVLGNGNLLVSSNYWNNGGTIANAGAVTWMNGTSGLLSNSLAGGAVSTLNSLVGSTAGDKVGGNDSALVYELIGNGNVAVASIYWNGTRGAVTWMNGTTGQLAGAAANGGVITSTNSLVGSTAGDMSGTGYNIMALGNGNLLVKNLNWDNGVNANVGALTWMNGATGELSNSTVGTRVYGDVIGMANSLVGSYGGVWNGTYYVGQEQIGGAGVDELFSGNVLVRTHTWRNPGTSADYAGAVTWMDGATGKLVGGNTGGMISDLNSLVGDIANSQVGNYNLTQLGNGNVVIKSTQWNGGAGAVTWMNGVTGALSNGTSSGVISAANSLIGSTANDNVGLNGVTVVTDNSTYWNYAVQSSGWDNVAATAANAGAITWVNGATGKTSDTLGTISSANSVVGSTAGDAVGATSVLVLGNGNVVFASSSWNGGMGAVTWMKGLDGTLADATNGGAVSAANSLVGSNQTLQIPPYTQGDQIGSGGLTLISNYSTYWNYAIRSPNWTNGAATGAGAVTLGNGATGTVGVVSAGNSLVGNATGDAIGSGGITLPGNGHFVVSSPDWGSGGIMYAGLGAVTWMNGQTGALSNGSIGGVVGSTNSLVGSTSGDRVGFASTVSFNGLGGINTFINGNLLIRSQAWSGGVSALSWMSGSTGRLAGGATGGAVSATNSLLGSTVNDNLGSGEVGVTQLLVNGNWVITSANWGSASDWGAVTWMNSTNGQLADGTFGGVLSAANSLVGSATTPGWIEFFCDCGTNGTAGGIRALSDGNYVAYWQDFNPDVGAVAWGNGTAGSVGALTSSNSLLAFVNPVVEMLGSPGKVLVGSKTANGGAGGLYVLGGSTSVVNSNSFFTTTPGADAIVAAGWISSTLNAGTNVVLQANNDITQQSGAAISSTGTGGLTLQAGRSVVLNDFIDIAGTLNVSANDAGANQAFRNAGSAVLDTSAAALTASIINMANEGGDILAGSLAAIAGAVNIKATNNILLTANSSITTTAAGSVNMDSDSDASGGGGIYLDTGTSIISNGGGIYLSGGTAPYTTGRAVGNGSVTGGITFNSGIYVLGDITAGNGIVGMRGEGKALGSGSNHLADGITFAGGLLSSNGTVNINGVAHVLSASTTGTDVTAGVDFLGGGTRLSTQTGTVTVTGLNDAGAGFCRAQGITVEAGTIIETTGIGTLTLNGTSTGLDTGWGVGIFGGTVQTTAAGGGAITLNGINVTNPDGGVVILDGNVLSSGGEIRIIGAGLGGSGTIGTSTIGGASSGDILIKANNSGPINITSASSINAGSNTLTLMLAGGPFNDNGSSITAGALRLLGSGTFNLGGANNNVATLAANVTGSVTYNDTNGFAIGSVTSFDGTAVTTTAGVTTGNSTFIGSATGNITLNASGLINAGTANVTLVTAGGNFINNSGSTAPITATNTRIYTSTSAGTMRNGMVPTASLFNGTYIGGFGAQVIPTTGTVFLYTQATAPTLTIVADSLSKVYGTTDPSFTYTAAGLVGGDNTGSVLSGALSRVAGENVAGGPYAINQGTLTADAGFGYILAYTGANLGITPAALNITGLSASNKVYDATTLAALTGVGIISAVGAVSLDAVSATANFVDKNVGNGKAVSVSGFSLTGADAANYSLVQPILSANITPASLTVSATGVNRLYNGTAVASVNLSDSRLAGDVLTASYGAANFPNKDIGTSKQVDVTGISLSGTDAGNYTFNTTAMTFADISPAALTVSGIPKNKVLGTPDPLLTYMVSGLYDPASAVLAGELERELGETIGTYQVNIGTLALLTTNYNLIYVPCNFTILAPTVVQEITQMTLQSAPAEDTATTSQEEEKKKESAELLAEAAIVDDSGQPLADPLPVCR